MRYIPRNVSVRPHQVIHRVTTVDALLKNNTYPFLQRCASYNVCGSSRALL